MKKLSQYEFIDKLYKKYKDKFDFTNTIYVDMHQEVEFKCNNCDSIEKRTPMYLLYSNGKCTNCDKIKNKRNINYFIERVEKTYGKGLFDFSNSIYTTCDDDIEVKCNTCGGTFKITPSNFYRGHGCPLCNAETNRKKTLEEVIALFKEKFGDRYDYSLIKEYVNRKTPMPILCHELDKNGSEHGIFYQSFESHYYYGCGCSKCNGGVKKSLEYYINKAKDYHKDENVKPLYDYSLIKEIENEHTVIPIICKKHGIFYQEIGAHSRGAGCQFCRMSKLEQEIMNFLNDNNIKFIFQANKSTLEWLDKLTLDFYLPDYNAAIECQGEQHFGRTKNTSSIFTDERINQIKERDERKKNLCEENNVKLLYFSNLNIEYPYHVFKDKNELLTEIIKKIKK